MNTYEKKEIITEEKTYNNKPSLHDVERTDDLTTEKQHVQNQNPSEKTERVTEIKHVDHDLDHHGGGTTEQHVHKHIGVNADQNKVGKNEYVGDTEHHHVGKTEHVGTEHHKVGKTEHVTTEHVTTDQQNVGKTGHVTTDHVTTDQQNVGKTGHVTTDHHHKTKKDKTHKTHKVGKKVKSDHVMNDNEEKPSMKEKAKEKLHDLGEKVGFVKPETHTTTITEELNPDGTKKIIKEERNHPEHVGFGKPETEIIRTEEIVDARGNKTILTEEGRENVGFLTQPETHKTKVFVEHGVDGRDKIITERKDNPEHVGLFLPETAKISTEEYANRDGTRTIKTKEETEHMGLATQPETLKTYSKVQGETDGSRTINKEIRTDPEQIAIKKPANEEVVKIKEHIDPYGHSKSVEVIEGQDHKGLGNHGTNTVGYRGAGDANTTGNFGANIVGKHDTSVGNNDPGFGKGVGYTGTGVGGTGVDNTNTTTYKHPA